MDRQLLESICAAGGLIGIWCSDSRPSLKWLEELGTTQSEWTGSLKVVHVFAEQEADPRSLLADCRKMLGPVKAVLLVFDPLPTQQRLAILASLSFSVLCLQGANSWEIMDSRFVRTHSSRLLFLGSLQNAPVAIHKEIARQRKLWSDLSKTELSTFLGDPGYGVTVLQQAFRVSILLHNPEPAWRTAFLHWWWLGSLLAAILVFVPSVSLDVPESVVRNLDLPWIRMRQPNYIQFQFDGYETLQRLCKFAIGKYTALVASESEIKEYMQETLQRNGVDSKNWKIDPGGAIYPSEGTALRFYAPSRLHNEDFDSLKVAYDFFQSIIADSISYVTEYFDATGKTVGRVHDGVDIGSRMGARILAPFSGKAWTARDERGGVVMALVDGEDVLLFMHCDKLLYLDGQETMQRDPIATVGITGHTTGPHVHLAAGTVNPKGSRMVGPIRYDVMDPVAWVHRRLRRGNDNAIP